MRSLESSGFAASDSPPELVPFVDARRTSRSTGRCRCFRGSTRRRQRRDVVGPTRCHFPRSVFVPALSLSIRFVRHALQRKVIVCAMTSVPATAVACVYEGVGKDIKVSRALLRFLYALLVYSKVYPQSL